MCVCCCVREMYQIILKSPTRDAASVQVTGTFDDWKLSIPSLDGPSIANGFKVIVQEKKDIEFKFVVNGTQWITSDDYKVVTDEHGNNNNIVYADEFESIEEKKEPRSTTGTGVGLSEKTSSNLETGITTENKPTKTDSSKTITTNQQKQKQQNEEEEEHQQQQQQEGGEAYAAASLAAAAAAAEVLPDKFTARQDSTTPAQDANAFADAAIPINETGGDAKLDSKAKAKAKSKSKSKSAEQTNKDTSDLVEETSKLNIHEESPKNQFGKVAETNKKDAASPNSSFAAVSSPPLSSDYEHLDPKSSADESKSQFTSLDADEIKHDAAREESTLDPAFNTESVQGSKVPKKVAKPGKPVLESQPSESTLDIAQESTKEPSANPKTLTDTPQKSTITDNTTSAQRTQASTSTTSSTTTSSPSQQQKRPGVEGMPGSYIHRPAQLERQDSGKREGIFAKLRGFFK